MNNDTLFFDRRKEQKKQEKELENKRFNEQRRKEAENKVNWTSRLAVELEKDELAKAEAEERRQALKQQRHQEMLQQIEEGRAEARLNSIH